MPPGKSRRKVAHDLLCRPGSILLSLRRGHAGLQAAHHVEAPASRALVNSSWVRLKGTQSSLRFNWPGTRGNSKPRGITPITSYGLRSSRSFLP